MCTDQKGCVDSAEADTCAAYVSEENNGCGANVKTVTQQCSTFLSLVSYVCGSGTGTN
jgi:hypothetical protein